jgi:hypothetical protein
MNIYNFFECVDTSDQPQESQVFCKKCQTMQPLSNYGRDSGSNKLSSCCKTCTRRLKQQTQNLLKVIPPPPKDYLCPGCERDEETIRKVLRFRKRKAGRIWSLDHDHNNGKFRGWICNKCNLALGNMNDDLEYARRLVKYLEKYEENSNG